MRLQDIMNTKVRSIQAEAPAEVAWQLMRTHTIRHLVVMEDNAPAGILSDRDLAGVRGGGFRKGKTAGDLMARRVVTASPRTTVREAANLLRGHIIGCLPVFDGGKLVGIVTVTDLLNLIGRGTERSAPKGQRPTMRPRGPRRGSIMAR